MNEEHSPAPWYNPELPGLHCAKCAATVNLGALESIGVPRGRQITYAQQILAHQHRGSAMWSLSSVGIDDFLVPKALQSTATVA